MKYREKDLPVGTFTNKQIIPMSAAAFPTNDLSRLYFLPSRKCSGRKEGRVVEGRTGGRVVEGRTEGRVVEKRKE